MSGKNLSRLFFSVSMLAAIALVGCSSSKDDGPAMMPSDGTGMAKTPAIENSLSMLLPDPSNQFVPAAAAMLKRIFGATPSSDPTDEFRVESIRSDGANGFHVTYVIGDGASETLHFEADDFISFDYYKDTGTGEGEFWFWSNLGSFDGPEKNRGPEEVKYFDSYGISNSRAADGLSYRGYVTAGTETGADNLPTGTASYFGRAYADTYEKDNPTTRLRARMHGRLELTADFDGSTLDGRISNIQQRPPGVSSYSLLSDTTQFGIENGQIVDGRFTAKLKGQDTNASAPVDETVLGYEGTVSGVFYGPAAEEAGGALSASSTAHGRVLVGWFAAKQPDDTEVDQPVLSNTVSRDLVGSTSSLADATEVTSIKDDGAGGFRVTYLVDGTEQTVHMEADDYGSFSSQTTSYYKRDGDRGYWLWNLGRYSGVSGFNYFDARGWADGDWEAGSNTTLTHTRQAFAIYGTPTEVGDLPAGTATYAGSVYADIHSATDPNRSARGSARGRLTLNADFGASTISGAIDQMTNRMPGQSRYEDITTEIMIENGMISDNQFSADLTTTVGYSGDMTGHFYGPAAEEVGGVWQGTNSVRNTVLQGYFGGRKQ